MMNQSRSSAHPLVFVTGYSGAGMSSALKSLEDIGYEVFDNFPLALVDPLVRDTDFFRQAIAIGIDTRTRGFDPAAILGHAEKLKATVLFLTADEAILQKRFTETRRRHPLAKDRPVSAGIKREQELLYPLRAGASLVIDTGDLSIHDLRRMLSGHFGLDESGKLTVSLMSFGFRYGLPREADIVMDVRFLKNPHWVPELKALTGLDHAVGDYIEQDETYSAFLDRLKSLIETILPRYRSEGKSYLTIAIGCTGGHHRSVYTVEKLKPFLATQGVPVHVAHRDIDR